MKRLGKWIIPVLALFITASCQSKNKSKKSQETQKKTEKVEPDTKLSPQDLEKYETAYFASGCFWCVEVIFENVKGVAEVISGYAGGTEENPTYEQVSYGKTSHAEAVEVYYDPKVISFTELVQVFFGSHDPTTLNRQGPDRGPQYRSIAFYKNDSEKKVIEAYIKALTDNRVYDRPIVTEVMPFTIFYKAEEYHQDYERRNPDNPYIRNISIPRYNRFKKNFAEYLKENTH
ncbi:peptide-methionine (S)-S-oxide reductase MsrA [Lentiprolixibacter aurantiacus]|uniref:Peptide methionine sulfoxide reductase MsrA n=1 Tax=Lentiprolixibacter aurantiacus TaxID=2993939 RepID=A0AAE3MNG9_9FLAO|nr:peptide-methionine (S)-S-oxide reductase MsrA [Lentiprolixibacter aurantiacus]MCX2720443.1 peptide-methionine (S)-S-oxide reductase MsrA [Lentiprolixibacter aurantiacus]